jgi:hypothetical protein
MNILTISSLSLASLLLAAPALADAAPTDSHSSAPGVALERPADHDAVVEADSFVYGGSTDLFSSCEPGCFYRSLRAKLDADTILGTANLSAVVYTDGNARERSFTIDDFTLDGPTRADGLVSGYSGRLHDALVEMHSAPAITNSDGAIDWLTLPALVDAATLTTCDGRL